MPQSNYLSHELEKQTQIVLGLNAKSGDGNTPSNIIDTSSPTSGAVRKRSTPMKIFKNNLSGYNKEHND